MSKQVRKFLEELYKNKMSIKELKNSEEKLQEERRIKIKEITEEYDREANIINSEKGELKRRNHYLEKTIEERSFAPIKYILEEYSRITGKPIEDIQLTANLTKDFKLNNIVQDPKSAFIETIFDKNNPHRYNRSCNMEIDLIVDDNTGLYLQKKFDPYDQMIGDGSKKLGYNLNLNLNYEDGNMVRYYSVSVNNPENIVFPFSHTLLLSIKNSDMGEAVLSAIDKYANCLANDNEATLETE